MFKKYLFFLFVFINLLLLYEYTPAEQPLPEKNAGGPRIDIDCNFCHIETLIIESSLAERSKTRSSSRDMCYSCHDGSVKDSRNTILKINLHLDINSIQDENKKPDTAAAGNLPLDKDNNFYCGTCHLPHQLSEKRVEEPGFFRVSLEKLCQSCHEKGRRAEKKLTGLISHPVDINLIVNPAEKINLPLLNNKMLVCSTCHEIHSNSKNFLYLENQKGELCAECHTEQKAVAGTNHDLSAVLPDSKNGLGKKAGESGVCGSCHLVHNAFNVKLWALKIPPGGNVIQILCEKCHNKNGIAGKSFLENYSHPMNIPILKYGLITTLPLYTPEGIELISGNITCSTCHNVHKWSPKSEGEKQAGTVDGTGENSFLRKTASSSSELCADCHQKESYVLKTNHDLTFVKPYTLNINGSSVEKSGVCSACHLIHNAPDEFLWARKLPNAGIIPEKFCKSCHQKNGLAKNSIIGDTSHILDVKIPNDISVALPFYDKSGKKTRNGVITCLTCHNPHLWDPGYFINESDKQSSMETKENKKDENKTFTNEQVDSAYAGEVSLIQGDHIFIDLEEKFSAQENIKLLVIDDNNAGKAAVKIEKLNPYSKTFKAFAKVLTKDPPSEIILGDYVIDESVLFPSRAVKGNGSNSFLRIANNASSLCLGCHPGKRSVLSTKHDLTVFTPPYYNAQNNNPAESGICSGCHLVHNAYNNLLAAKKIEIDPADPSSGICSTCHSKNGAASKKALSPSSHHFNQQLSAQRPSIRSPANYLPLFDKTGAKRTDDGLVSCSTCHDVHQWDPADPKITGKEEGNAENSFLRIKNNENRICNECHLAPKRKPMTAAALALEEKDIFVSMPPGEENPFFINISSFQNGQIVNNSEQILKGEISNKAITQATLIFNGTAFPVKAEKGSFEDHIKLTEGKNNIKVTAINKNGISASSSLLTLTLDVMPLKILSYVYPKPVKLSNEFRIKLIFNKAIDPNSMPKIDLISDGYSSPAVKTGGEIKTTYQYNDTYLTPDIVLDKDMAGNITIAASNIRDLAGNKIEKLAEESFKLGPDKGFNLDKPDCIDILEGKNINSPQINVKFNITDAEKMIISEDITFRNAVWENFTPLKTFILSNNTGGKYIHFKFKDNAGNISVPVLKTCSFTAYDENKVIQKIIKNDLVLTKENSPYYLQGEILVSRGAALTVQPGVKLLFSELKKPDKKTTFVTEKPSLCVEGRLICNGEKGSEIDFTYQNSPPRPGDWEGIIIKNTNENILNHTRISCAKTGIALDNSSIKITNCYLSNNYDGISAINNSIVDIESSVISNNKNNGIIMFDSEGKITKNEFSKNKTGIFCNDIISPSISGNYIMKNENGIICQGGSSPYIANNTIIENNSRGLTINYLSYPAVVNNLLVNNKEEGIFINESSPLIYKNLIRDNNVGVLCEKTLRKFVVAENSIFNNKKFNFYLKNYTSELNVSNNWWGTENTGLIDLYLYDKNEDLVLGKLIYQPILHAQAFSEIALSITETQKPAINNIFFKKPVRINPAFRMKIDFTTPVNPYIEPKLYLKNLSGGNDPVIINNNWCFMDGKESNSVIFTPEILIDTTMGGMIEAVLENIQSLSGSIMEKIKAVTFEVETSLGIKEGEFTGKKEINIISNYPNASEIQISENSNFSGAPWTAYNKTIPFTLSGPAGEKSIYVHYKNAKGEISPPEKLTIDYDNNPPKIIASEIPPEDIKNLRSLKIKLVFDETLNINNKPALTAVINSNYRIPISKNEGYFASENGFNNVYYSPTITLKENFYGDVFFEVEDITDLSGNKIPVTKLSGFRYDVILPEIKNVIIREGRYTNHRDVHLLINAIKAYEIQVSENPLFSDEKWFIFTPDIAFNLSSGAGRKIIYLRIRDRENNISGITTINTALDMIKPHINTYHYPEQVTLNDSPVITIDFDETLDTTMEPEIILISTGTENPVVPKGGTFYKNNDEFAEENNAYTTPPILFKPSMGGAITIVVKNAKDLAGNIMDITYEKTFQLDTIPPILNSFTPEKEYTNTSKISFKIDAEDAHMILLSENKAIDLSVNRTWTGYKYIIPFSLSDLNGEKTIYLWLKDLSGNIGGPYTAKVIVDKIEPKILFYKFNFTPHDSSLSISFIFSETMDSSYEPQMQLIGSGRVNPKVYKGGVFSSTLLKNDTYTTTPILLNENMTGEITIAVNKIFGKAGNSIKLTANAGFFYSPIFPMITAVIPEKENSSYTPWVNFYLYVYGAKMMMVSEDPSFTKSDWINFTEYFQFHLSEGVGQKTIYFKFKDEKDDISFTNKTTVEKIDQPDNPGENVNNIELFPKDETKSREINIKNNLNNYTYQLISENPVFENAKWEDFKTKTKYVLSEAYGEKTLFLLFRDEIGNYSDLFSKKIYYLGPQEKLTEIPFVSENKNNATETTPLNNEYFPVSTPDSSAAVFDSGRESLMPK